MFLQEWNSPIPRGAMNPILFRISIGVSLAAMCVALASSANGETCCHPHRDIDSANPNAAATNHMCPVMPEERAEDSWTTVYRGKLIRFCCNNCVDRFRRDPEKYLAGLPQFPANEIASAGNLQIDPVKLRFLGMFLAAVAIAGLFRLWNGQRIKVGKSTLIRPLLIQLVLAGALAAAIHFWLTTEHHKLEMIKQRAVSDIHHATYFDFGVPPVPHRPEIEPALATTFYRGNDERSPVLHNGGNYQTAIFDLTVEHADGTPVRPGDHLRDQTLFLRFTIHKAKNAPLRMYDNKIMDKIYLTRSFDPLMGWDKPIDDQLHIESIEPGEVWECRFPLEIAAPDSAREFDVDSVTPQQLTRIDGIDQQVADWFVAYRDAGYPISNVDDLRQAGITGQPAQILSASLQHSIHEGVVYVCEAFFYKGRQMGARMHYGIKYKLRLENGIIQDDSEIWMGALSRSQKAAKGAIPAWQWLSSDPLPELPAPQDISDELLGIDDYDW